MFSIGLFMQNIHGIHSVWMRRTTAVFFAVLFLGVVTPRLGFSQQKLAQPMEALEGRKYWDGIRQQWEKTREGSEKTTGQLTQWVQEDLKKIGAWEYRIEVFPFAELKALETQLNLLGEQRWECFWVEKRDAEYVMMFKKSKRSWIKSIPTQDILHFIPDGEKE
jgi:hypothetical protein